MNDLDWFKAIKKPVTVKASGPHYDTRTVYTLEGEYAIDEDYAEGGYYIIRGIEGEIYPCEKDIFENTYREAKQEKLTTERIRTIVHDVSEYVLGGRGKAVISETSDEDPRENDD